MLCIKGRRRQQRNAARAALLAACTVSLVMSRLASAADAPKPAAPATRAPTAERFTLPPAAAASDWDGFKLQAAQRLMAANPDITYTGPVLDPLLAIPVLEVELERDGRVRSIRVVRVPTQAGDTTQLAIDAVHRAAPYGDMSRLAKPWKWVEVFLFDEDRRFKPRTLDN